MLCLLELAASNPEASIASTVDASLGQCLLQASHADARRGFRCSSTPPMGLKAHGVVIAIAPQSLELPNPINDTAAHRRPFILVIGLVDNIFAMAVADALFRKKIVP